MNFQNCVNNSVGNVVGYFIFWLGFLFSINTVLAAQLTPEQRASKLAGLVSYNIGNPALAADELEVAARAGDPDAQYYLGEIERHKTMLMNPAAHFWYVSAARGGDLFAMLRLIYSNDDDSITSKPPARSKTTVQWRNVALRQARTKARAGDSEAMLVLYFLDGNLEWLVRSARAGLPESQFKLARVYQIGGGVFFNSTDRSREIRKWIIAAANGNHVPAIRLLIKELKDYQREESTEWARNAIRLGDLDTTFEYHDIDMGEEHRSVSSYGLLSLIADSDVATGIAEKTARKMADLRKKMTPQQLQAGAAFAEEWKKTHPPLSRFLPKYGY